LIKRIIVIYGTSAELLKLYPLIRKLKTKYEIQLVNSNQQIEDTSILEKYLEIEPDVKIENTESLAHKSKIQSIIWIIKNFYKIYLVLKINSGKVSKEYNLVLIHGDTITATLAAIICKILKLRCAHIEAGLRSNKLLHPFPEEINRILISKCSKIHFCQDDRAIANIGINKNILVKTYGNTIFDMLKIEIEKNKTIDQSKDSQKFGLVSLHRVELLNSNRALRDVFQTLIEISKRIKLVLVVDNLTKRKLIDFKILESILNSNIEIREKMIYPDFIQKVLNCDFIITDSGGLQEEAAVLGIPCLIYRKATERNDGLGVNAVLSNWDNSITLKFVEEYMQYRKSYVETNVSPTDIIFEFINKFN
jgi:UDP-N-acetylglucosamine 2-epimerase (non-hydrolysing)